jgi:hypothetical protein
MKKLRKRTDVFYRRLTNTKPVKPSLMKLIEFMKQKQAFSKAPQDSADYMFWKEKGWFNKDTRYYYDARINPVNKLIVTLLSKINV